MLLAVTIPVSILNWLVPTLLGIGVVLCVTEACLPGFGFFGITGIAAFIAGVVCYALKPEQEAWRVLVLVVVVILFVCGLFLMITRSAKYGALGKTPFVENKTALPVDYDLDAMMSNSKYMNKFGEIIMDCRPIGKMKINEDIIEVYSRREFLSKGTIVKVVEVDDDKVFVDVVD